MKKYLIGASILSANLAKIGEEVENVLKAGADSIHFDCMDNHYVPNLTFGPILCKALRDYGIKAQISIHLMAKPVDSLIVEFAKVGADCIIFHPEASYHVDRSVQLIKDSGCKVGIALNPATSLDRIYYILHKLDLVLLMSVNPGFGGQKFIKEMIDKISETRELIKLVNSSAKLSVDGGINSKNIEKVVKAGADICVVGAAIFKSKDYKSAILELRKKVKV